MTRIALWAGVECTVNRVGDGYHDQLVRSGHVDRAEDIDRFASLGVSALRYPVLWERVAPEHGVPPNWSWSDARLDRIRSASINPIVGLLHHGSGPRYTSLLDPQFPDRLAQYASDVAERYPWVSDWTPVNEPLTTARFSGLYGLWYPHRRDDLSFVRALLNELRGTVLVMERVRRVNPRARLVQTEDLGRTFGTPRVRRQVAFEGHRRWLTWDLLCGSVDRHHAMYRWLRRHGATEADLAFFVERPCPPDILGINHYLTSDRWLDHRTALYPPERIGGNGSLTYADMEAVRARPKGIVGHEHHLLAAWQRYQRPVALTEVHLGCTREQQMRWLVEAWTGANRARERGADVRAITAWSLLGSFDWDSLVTQQRGHYEPGAFDVRGDTPRPTALAEAIRDLSAGRVPEHPAVANHGWWRKPTRLLWGPGASSAFEPPLSGAPLLVIGGRGTLGRAFRRICLERGLRVHTVARSEMDLCDAPRIDAVLRSLKPWAVINAAGYVRVDAAEQDRAACWRDNVTGTVNLAAACRRRRLPLVTFSSDLVFDGADRRPYLEDASLRPLNVYGESKLEAERRVLELLPDALVVRTSAFFGPWDEYNFATVTRRALAGGEVFRAADDYVVSPTYVPDLVNAALDLLIDGERGIWHLANEGAVTWFEFAEMVVRAAGANSDLLRRCATRDVWQPAVRPTYSVLGSARGQLLRPLEAAVAAYVRDVSAAESQEAVRMLSS
jgi:dTDP-4-dehydrorhamnose reductase